MILNKKHFCIYFSVFFFSTLFSQQKNELALNADKSDFLSEVLITATRVERQLSAVPLNAQIINAEEIQEINAVRLSDLLSEQTGLITVPDFGGGEGLQLQGFDSQHTLILIDGVPIIGRSAGTLDLNRITVGNIKQIEIIKGASSSLYGNEALGGVINIITEDPKNGFKGDFNYRGASFNTHDFGSNINYKKNKIGINFFANRLSSDGYDLITTDELKTVEPFKNYTLGTKLTYEFSNKTDVLFSGRFYDQQQDNIASKTLKGKSKINDWNALTKVTHNFNDKWVSFLELYATKYKTNEFLKDEIGRLFSDSDFKQFFFRPELRTTYTINKKNTFIGGLGLTHETLNRSNFFKQPEFNSPYIYLQYDGQITDKINVLLGGRFDDHNAYQSQFSPKSAIRYKVHNQLSFKGSFGRGFKAPDFRQLYFDFTNATVGYTILGYNAVSPRLSELQANGELLNITVPLSEFESALNPERSWTYNFGIDYNPFKDLKLHLNIFRNNIDNLIDTRVVARKTNGQNVFSYYNVYLAYTQGLEFNSTYKINQNLRFKAGYQLLYAKDREAEELFENGQVFARLTSSSPAFRLRKSDYFGLFNRSRHTANFKVFLKIPKWNLDTNLRAVYRSKFGVVDTNGNNYLDSYDEFAAAYTIWDIAFNKKLSKHFKLGFGMDNIFDFTNPQNVSNIPGRIVYGTLNINF